MLAATFFALSAPALAHDAPAGRYDPRPPLALGQMETHGADTPYAATGSSLTGDGPWHVTATLSNSDDNQRLFLNGRVVASTQYGQTSNVDLGQLDRSDTILFESRNRSAGYAWGLVLRADGQEVLRDWAGSQGVTGANGNDQSRPNQLVRRLQASGAGEILEAWNATVNEPSSWCGATRSTDDQGHEVENGAGKYHVIYAYLSGQPNRFRQLAPYLQSSSFAASGMLSQLYGRALRYDIGTDCGPRYLDMSAAGLSMSQLDPNDDYWAVIGDLRRQGFTDPDKNYLVFVDSGGRACGLAAGQGSTSRAADNGYNRGGSFALLYRYASPSTPVSGGLCGGAALHEILHTLGVVQGVAPNSDGGGHCNDASDDVMCSGPRRGGGPYVDYGNDDYWDPAGGALPWWTANLSRYICPNVTCNNGKAVDLLPAASAGYTGPRYRVRLHNADDRLCARGLDTEGQEVHLFCVGYKGDRTEDVTGALLYLAKGRPEASLRLIATNFGDGHTYGVTVERDGTPILDESSGVAGSSSSDVPQQAPDPETGWRRFYDKTLTLRLAAPTDPGGPPDPGNGGPPSGGNGSGGHHATAACRRSRQRVTRLKRKLSQAHTHQRRTYLRRRLRWARGRVRDNCRGSRVKVQKLAAQRRAATSSQAVGFLNQQRQANGLPSSLAVDPNLTYGCQKHNYYMDAHGLGHGESPGSSRYSQAGAAQGQYGFGAEVLTSGGGYGPGGANPWETAPIHLYLMLDPSFSKAGYDASYGYGCMRLGGYLPEPETATFYSYPGPGSSGIYPAERAAESPYTPQQLVGIPADQQTGPNILLFSRGAGADLRATSYSLTGPTGNVPARLVVESTQNSVGNGSWFAGGGVLIPERPLSGGQTYTVSINWRNNEAEHFTQEFSFTTAQVPGGEPGQTLYPRLGLRRIGRRGGEVLVHLAAANVLRGRTAYIKAFLQARRCGISRCWWRSAGRGGTTVVIREGGNVLALTAPRRRQRVVVYASTRGFTSGPNRVAAARSRLITR